MNLEYSTTASDPALCMARTALYRFAALSLLHPRAGAWEQLRAARHEASSTSPTSPQSGCAKVMCATMPSPKKVDSCARARVRSKN